MSTTTETKAGELREECVRILCGRPVKNMKMLEEVFGETTAESLKNGNGMTSEVQAVTAALSHVLDGVTEKKCRCTTDKNAATETPKRRGRPPKAAAAATGEAPKKRGRPPKAKAAATGEAAAAKPKPPAKKRGRPPKAKPEETGEKTE